MPTIYIIHIRQGLPGPGPPGPGPGPGPPEPGTRPGPGPPGLGPGKLKSSLKCSIGHV